MTEQLKRLSEDQRFIENPLVNLETPHADDRGEILPLVDEEMKSAVMISSKKGSLRANHYHLTDWHFCYVLSGAIDYYHRPVGSDTAPKCVRIEKGQLFFTPPMVEHTMCFPEDTVFLCLGKNSRDQKCYEADVRRVNLV